MTIMQSWYDNKITFVTCIQFATDHPETFHFFQWGHAPSGKRIQNIYKKGRFSFYLNTL